MNQLPLLEKKSGFKYTKTTADGKEIKEAPKLKALNSFVAFKMA